MTTERIIALSGDLGSGKSSVSVLLADRLHFGRISTGDLHRTLAAERGVSTLELNRIAEEDQGIDHRVDSSLRDLAGAGSDLVVDSRMAWHFIPQALKVNLLVDAKVGARRVAARSHQLAEDYSNAEEAQIALRERQGSERRRFSELYAVDVERLRNYDLVIDTSDASVEEVVDAILQEVEDPSTSPGPTLYLSPRRIIPTEPIDTIFRVSQEVVTRESCPNSVPLEVCFSGGAFYMLHDHRMLSRYIRVGYNLVPGVLRAEGSEQVVGGMSADEYAAAEATPTKRYDWEDAHQVTLT